MPRADIPFGYMNMRKTKDYIITYGHIDHDANGKPIMETAQIWKKTLRVPMERYEAVTAEFKEAWNSGASREELNAIYAKYLTPYQQKIKDKCYAKSNFMTQSGI